MSPLHGVGRFLLQARDLLLRPAERHITLEHGTAAGGQICLRRGQCLRQRQLNHATCSRLLAPFACAIIAQLRARTITLLRGTYCMPCGAAPTPTVCIFPPGLLLFGILGVRQCFRLGLRLRLSYGCNQHLQGMCGLRKAWLQLCGCSEVGHSDLALLRTVVSS